MAALDGSDLFVTELGRIGEYTTSGATVNASLILTNGEDAGIVIAPAAPGVPEPSTLGLGLAGLGLGRLGRILQNGCKP
jgi:hypothetical protein